MFDLFLEIKPSYASFQTYKPGGTTIKVHLVDLDDQVVHSSVNVRAQLSNSVEEFKGFGPKTVVMDAAKPWLAQAFTHSFPSTSFLHSVDLIHSIIHLFGHLYNSVADYNSPRVSVGCLSPFLSVTIYTLYSHGL